MEVVSKRWKIRGWAKLFDYIEDDHGRGHDGRSFRLTYNFNGGDRKSVIEAFREQDTFRKLRKNGVVLYHEVLSFHLKDKPNLTPSKLMTLCLAWIHIRCPNALVYARPHWHNDNVHIHLIISGTEFHSAKTLRLSDKRFRQVRVDIEDYQVSQFPELKHSIAYNTFRKQFSKNRIKEDRNTRRQRKFSMEKRLGQKLTEKEYAIEIVRSCLLKAQDFEGFVELLQQEGYKLHCYHGKTVGINVGNRNYRFKTLGMDKEIMRELERKAKDKSLYQSRIQKLEILQGQNGRKRHRSL